MAARREAAAVRKEASVAEIAARKGAVVGEKGDVRVDPYRGAGLLKRESETVGAAATSRQASREARLQAILSRGDKGDKQATKAVGVRLAGI